MNSSRRLLLQGAFSTAVVASVPRFASADDGELRRHVRRAEMVSYSTFKPVEGFAFPSVHDGHMMTVPRDVAGKVVLLNMWATWCPPCTREMASLQEIHGSFKDEGFLVLAVNIRDRTSSQQIKAWLDARSLTFPAVKGDYDKLAMMLRTTIPQTFVLDRAGRLIAWRQGQFNWADTGVRDLVHFMVREAG